MESSFDFVAHVGGIKFMRGMVKTITHKHRPTNPTIKQVNEKKKTNFGVWKKVKE